MTDQERAAMQQALECLRGVARGKYDGNAAGVCAALEAALAQQADPTGKKSLQVESVVAENATTQQQIEDTPPSDYQRGYWDGFRIGKREGRIEAEDELAQQQAEPPGCDHCRHPLYAATKCRVCGRVTEQAEPVEPVAKVELMMTGGNAGLATRIVEIDDHLRERLRPGQLLYTAPPKRVPLTEEEIESCRQQGYAHTGLLAPFDFGEAARAVERKVRGDNT